MVFVSINFEKVYSQENFEHFSSCPRNPSYLVKTKEWSVYIRRGEYNNDSCKINEEDIKKMCPPHWIIIHEDEITSRIDSPPMSKSSRFRPLTCIKTVTCMSN